MGFLGELYIYMLLVTTGQKQCLNSSEKQLESVVGHQE